MSDLPTERWVYAHIDSKGDVLYVGSTFCVGARNERHSYDSPWWPYVADTGAIGPFPRQESYDIERELIAELSPPFNTRFVPLREDVPA